MCSVLQDTHKLKTLFSAQLVSSPTHWVWSQCGEHGLGGNATLIVLVPSHHDVASLTPICTPAEIQQTKKQTDKQINRQTNKQMNNKKRSFYSIIAMIYNENSAFISQ